MQHPEGSGEAPAPATEVERRAATPLVGAVAGMTFAVLFGLSVGLIRSSMGDPAGDTGEWMRHGTGQFKLGVALMPFAGIFFLWFIGVSRQRLGRWEDRFISTIILGSGLLFLAMVFAAAGLAGTLLAMYSKDPVGFPGSETYTSIQLAVAKIFGVYALRMAAVFLICRATAWLRHGVMPRWLALPTYAVALVLLLVVGEEAWAVLIFPV